jgi:hypothetical protein
VVPRKRFKLLCAYVACLVYLWPLLRAAFLYCTAAIHEKVCSEWSVWTWESVWEMYCTEFRLFRTKDCVTGDRYAGYYEVLIYASSSSPQFFHPPSVHIFCINTFFPSTKHVIYVNSFNAALLLRKRYSVFTRTNGCTAEIFTTIQTCLDVPVNGYVSIFFLYHKFPLP